MPIAHALDHFVVLVDDLVVAEEFYIQAFDGDITKCNGLNTRQYKCGAVSHTFFQIGGKRMGVYLQSETRPLPKSLRGLPTYTFTTNERGLDEVAMNYPAASCGVSNPSDSENSRRGKPREIYPERLKQKGNDRDYFARQKEFTATESWLKKLGTNRK